MLSATLPRTSAGCWGTHATSARHVVDPAAREVDAADRDATGRRLQEPEQQRRHGALAGAALAHERDGLAGRQLEVEPVEDAAGARRVGEGDALQAHRRRRGARDAAAALPRAPRPARRAARASGRRPPGRRRSRGTPRPAGAAAGTARARARARSARPARPSPPSTSRTPTVTATSATPRVAASSSTVPERKVRRSVPIVARRWRSLTSAMRAACAPPRLNERSVGRPRTTSRKSVDRQRSACQRSRVRCSVARPISHMKTGTSGSVSAMTSADSRSTVGHPCHDGERDDRREHDLRQVAGEVRLERLDALHRGRGDLAGLRPVGRRRLRRQPARDERQAQLGEHARSRAAPGDLHPPGQRAAAREGEREQDARRVAGPQPERPRRPRRRSAPAAWPAASTKAVVARPSAVSSDQERAHGPSAADEARVEGAHGLLSPRARRRRRASTGSAGRGADCSPPRRARNTW